LPACGEQPCRRALSPVSYQVTADGNLFASVNATLQAGIAALTAMGTEAKGIAFAHAAPAAE
jgi:hypothetical protein